MYINIFEPVEIQYESYFGVQGQGHDLPQGQIHNFFMNLLMWLAAGATKVILQWNILQFWKAQNLSFPKMYDGPLGRVAIWVIKQSLQEGHENFTNMKKGNTDVIRLLIMLE